MEIFEANVKWLEWAMVRNIMPGKAGYEIGEKIMVRSEGMEMYKL
jgi:hypothetical protein